VRASLTECGVPGCRVLRWERYWQIPGQPFIDPATYPPLSAAMTGTHDTEPVAAWWEALPVEEREAFIGLPAVAARGMRDARAPWSDWLRDVILELAYRSGSDRLFVPVQDLFGWRDRINTPATVGPGNWTWCLPWPIDAPGEPASERAAWLSELSAATGRRGAADYTKAPPAGRGAAP
jgi:4-alpha-glucanotransferase